MKELAETPISPDTAPGLHKALVAVVWLTWALDLVGILYMYSELSLPFGFVTGALTMLGLRAWVQVELVRRRKWSRYALSIFAAFGVIMLFFNGLNDVFGLAFLVMPLTALFLLHAEPVRRWCTR